MLIQAFVPTKGAQMYCLLLKYYISKLGEGAACADTRGVGSQNLWKHDVILEHYLTMKFYLLMLASSIREGVKDTMSKATSKVETVTKPLSPHPPQKKECQKGHDALEIIHRPFILPKWIVNYFCNQWKVPQLGDAPNKMEDSSFGPKLTTKIDLNTTTTHHALPPKLFYRNER